MLLLGNEPWPATGSARKIVVTSGAVEADDTVDVVLPMAHPYEQAGSFTNLEGRVQGFVAGRPAAARASRRTGCCWPA